MGDIESFRDLFKKAEPFIAVCIFMMLIILAVLLFREQNLKKEISENCGWGEEDYYCYCERSQAIEIKNKAEGGGLNILNISAIDP